MLYKGKRTTRKCPKDRGITRGKPVPNITTIRATPLITMTDAQTGDIKGRATPDHLLTLKEAIRIAKSQRKKVYPTFLDATKALHKVWIDAIMYVMYKGGLNTKIWSTIKTMNASPTASIHPNKARTNKKNYFQRQHKTRRRPLCISICLINGRNKQGNSRNRLRNQNT